MLFNPGVSQERAEGVHKLQIIYQKSTHFVVFAQKCLNIEVLKSWLTLNRAKFSLKSQKKNCRKLDIIRFILETASCPECFDGKIYTSTLGTRKNVESFIGEMFENKQKTLFKCYFNLATPFCLLKIVWK